MGPEPREVAFYVKAGGSVSCLHDDDASAFLATLAGGPPVTRRASHVEPNGDGTWRADLAPSGGPVLQPYPTRREALAAEAVWLRDNVLGRPATGTEEKRIR